MNAKLLAATALGLLLLLRPAAQAQDLGGALDLGQLGQSLALSAAINADAERRAKEMGIRLDHSKAGSQTATTGAGAARLRYTATPALRRQTVDNLARRLQARSPAQAQALRTSFGPGGPADYARLYTAGLPGSGFQDNDAASSLASFLEVAYVVVNDLRDTKALTPAVDQGLRQQVAGLLSQNAAAKSPAQLAQLGEEMKLQTVVLMAGWQESLKSGQAAAFRGNIAQSFRSQFGLDLTQVRLTENGFVPK
ncbi:hypothetical protein LJ737_21875 [Hymenobacter sp. 15J16-1T3B]|uniref:DUF6683 family protein n=1 Tax=Hymenobacter sp. 15J16-1T3B TaxID=2886941 RepID=UPI001D1092B9|nr:DUF6683 family protein [Hymenobacter sp. 15J16-1T3B]MCC3159905.1 hypothetical protein [Hymenobacter sp. 15J16-1T3B]